MLTRKAIHNHCNRTGPAAREMSAASTTCAVRARHTRHVRRAVEERKGARQVGRLRCVRVLWKGDGEGALCA